MRPVVIVEGPPCLELYDEAWDPRVDGGPELLERGPLDPLDLPVRMGRTGTVGSELDLLLAQLVLGICCVGEP